MKRGRAALVVTGLTLTVIAGVTLLVTATSGPVPSVDAGWVHLSSKTGDLAVPSRSVEQTAALVLDVDGDGINDFVVGARREAPSLVWYRRQTVGWERYVIDPEVLPIEAGGAFHDIDGDGDLDIVLGEDSRGNKVYWWENPYPDYDPGAHWRRYVIKDSGENKHHDQIFGDFDGDGAAELVFWNQRAGKLFLAEIPPDPRATQPWPYTPIFEGAAKAEGLAKADLNGDGKTDLIGGGHWFEHVEGTRYIPHEIDAGMTFTRAAAGQLKEGGWPEIVLVVGDGVGPLRWYEWQNGSWHGHELLDDDVIHGHSLELADFDRDGHLDIYCAEMHTPGHKDRATAWIFHGDGRGQFTKEILSIGIGNHESRAADLDGDGDLDILTKPYTWDAPRLDVFLNRATRLDQWERHVVDSEKPWRSIFIDAADLDDDGHIDIVTGGWWYRNPGMAGGSWPRHSFGEPLSNLAAIYDFDGDGDLDVVGTQGEGSKANAKFAWARNDGAGSFTVLTNLAEGDGDFLQGVAVERFRGGELEVALSWHKSDKGIQILRVPADPSGSTWSIRRPTEVSQDEALSAGDIDNDGIPDLLLGTQWLRNTGSAWEAVPLASAGMPDRNRLADINGDGLLDAVVGFEAISQPGDVVWYENPGPGGVQWAAHIIATVIGPMSLDVADLDDDGDLDVVVGEHNTADPTSARLHVLENLDGAGGKWTSHLVSSGDEHHDGAVLVDIDGDGDLDIVSIGWTHGRVLLYENQARSTADSPTRAQ